MVLVNYLDSLVVNLAAISAKMQVILNPLDFLFCSVVFFLFVSLQDQEFLTVYCETFGGYLRSNE